MSGEFLGSVSQEIDIQDDVSAVSSSVVETADLETPSESLSTEDDAIQEEYTEEPVPEITNDISDNPLDAEQPNPFLVDDPDDPDSESASESNDRSQVLNPSEDDVVPADEIALAQSTTNLVTPTTALSINKPTPPTPEPSPRPTRIPSTIEEDSSSSSEDDDSPLELYLANLVLPTMFHPLPNVRTPLSSLEVSQTVTEISFISTFCCIIGRHVL